MNFTNAMKGASAMKQTENGLDALNTSFNSNLDLFAQIGAMRNRSDADIENLVSSAYREDALLCLKNLFYARDINEGLGERRAFRVAMRRLAQLDDYIVGLNLPSFLVFGRFDDIFCVVGTPAEKYLWDLIRDAWNEDIDNYKANKEISLMAKWLPSEQSHNENVRNLARKVADNLGLTYRQYRKNLSALRAKLNLVENALRTNDYARINYNIVPGGAMKKHYGTFYKNDTFRFNEYLEALKNHTTIKVDGKEVKAKINTKHLMPYEIVEKYKYWAVDPALEEMWKGIEDYVGEVSANMVVMADVSGSMTGRPMATSVGLGIYFAQHNNGAYHNKLMTFSSTPAWIELDEGATLNENIRKVSRADWGGSTNVEAAFVMILRVAMANKLTQEDLPKALVIITDMEFNECVGDSGSLGAGRWGYNYHNFNSSTFTAKMKAKYAACGYTLPEIVFWNANARNSTFHATKNEENVRMVSGQAASVFKGLVNGKMNFTPYDYMLEILGNKRYDVVKVNADERW